MGKEQLHKKSSIEEINDNIHSYSVDTYMLPAKISYFLDGARTNIYMYTMLFFVSTGLSPFEAGLINGLQQLGGIIGAPLMGLLTDKIGFRRVITISLCVMAVIVACIQPYLAATFGSKQNNMCPIKQDMSNYVSEKARVSTDKRLFYSLFVSAIFISYFEGSITSFVDAGVLQRVQSSPRKTTIGRQRYAASIGHALGAIAYSLSITYFPKGEISCYVGIFVVYSVLMICLSFSSYFLFRGLSITIKEDRSENVTRCLMNHLKRFDTIFFLITVIFNGIVQALMFSFLFIYLGELNAPTLLFGFSTAVNCLSAATVYVFSSNIINVCRGTMNAMCVSCFVWAIRLLCTAFLNNPYAILAIDFFHGFTYSLFRIASLEHLKDTTEEAIFNTMCGIINSLYLFWSRLLANVIGGKLYKIFGLKDLFVYTSMACLLWSTVTLFYLIIKRFQRKGCQNI